MTSGLSGRVAIVTGAAGGIGAATAIRLAGAGVIVLGVDLQPFEPTQAPAGRVEAFVADLTSDEAPDSIVAAALSRHDRLDILVNNAAVVGADASVEKLSVTDLRSTFEINVIAPFRLAAAAIPALKVSPAGRIINVGSINSSMASATGSAVYVASKHAVAGLTKSLAAELAKFGVTANYVLPGPTLTPMSAALGQAWQAHYARRVPMGRLLVPADIAGAITFLASDDAGMISGHGLAVDGGMLAVLS